MMMKALKILLLACCLACLDRAAAADEDYLTYEKFIAAVESGAVKTVSLDRRSQINGTYLVDGAERAFWSYGETGSANDLLLVRLLEEKEVAIAHREPEENILGLFNTLSGFLLFLVPIVTLILVFRINAKLKRVPGSQRSSESRFDRE